MSESINSSRRTAGSIRSLSSTSSRASEGYISDVEHGHEKIATRFSRRTPSVGGDHDHSSGRGTPQPNQDQVKRKREFKGRHIQMMAIGFFSPFELLIFKAQLLERECFYNRGGAYTMQVQSRL
jgi:amino acid permease